jgi:hypothetical protein
MKIDFNNVFISLIKFEHYGMQYHVKNNMVTYP